MEFQFSLDGLPQFAADFWKAVGASRVFAFHGNMGAGKTTIIEALCREKGVRSSMGSPTFSIINEYRTLQGQSIYHIDLYRLRDEQEVVQTGVEDTVYSGELCFVEWPGKAPQLFDEQTVHVYIEALSEKDRKVKLDLPARN